MTVKDLLETAVCDIGLSFFEDPNMADPELIFRFRNGEISEKDVLHENILNSQVHLMMVKDNMIYATVWEEGDPDD